MPAEGSRARIIPAEHSEQMASKPAVFSPSPPSLLPHRRTLGGPARWLDQLSAPDREALPCPDKRGDI